MDATQIISDSILESDEEESQDENDTKKGRPLAKLCVSKNEHIPETELPLFMGDNVLGRDPTTCSLALSAPSISKRHATICISVHRSRGRDGEMDMEALVWDLGSMNGTRKGRLKLTPNVRYALSDGDSLVLADIPCNFVSCAMNSVSSQGDLRTPLSRKSRGYPKSPEASGGKGGNKSTGNKTCVNREMKAEISSTKPPISASCLSFEQTPTQPQGTLVPESDSESEDERQGKRTRGRIALASDSDSHKSSPTFLSPVNKIVPESEDESPITPSSSFRKGPFRDVSLSKEVIVSDENDQHVMAKLERKVHLTGDVDLPVCAPEVSTNLVANFNMDSDTDMEGEEEGLASAGHVMLNSNQANQLPNTDQFHMDSDTDVDDDEGALHEATKTMPSSDDHAKAFHVISVIQPEEIAVDSDTDVDDNPAVSDTAGKAKPMSSACTTDTSPSKQQKDFCLDSETDVDEEAQRECEQNKSSSKTDASQTRLDTKSVSPDSIHAAPKTLPLDSDTDDEAQPTLASSEAQMVFGPTESCTTADTGADLGILPDSDTDVEADSPLGLPVATTTMSSSHTNMSETHQSDSNADIDLNESSMSPAGNVANPADHRVDSGTDVECKETDIQTPELCRVVTPGLPLPALQNCSTPVQFSDGEVENMDTQAFLSPSSVSFRRATVPAVALSSCSESQDEEDFVVAETQSFVLQTRDCQGDAADDHIVEPLHGLEPSDEEKDGQSSNGRSFHLGLSDSSHLQCQNQALAMENTQAFVFADKSLNLEDTQAYAAVSTGDTATTEIAADMEAAQAYDVDEGLATCSIMSEKDQVHFALQATQAYISEPRSDSENEIDEGNSDEETQPLEGHTSSTLAIAETQPVSGFEEEESLASEGEGREEHEEVAQPQERYSSKAIFIAETQPMHTRDDEDPEIPTNPELSAFQIPVDTEEDGESDEDSIPVSRKRKAKPLQLEETQPLCSPGAPLTETQPMVAVEDRESDDEDFISGPRRRKAKPLQLEEEQTQPFTNSELSVVDTQPMHIGLAEAQLMVTSGNGESNVESEEEKTPVLMNTEDSAIETQPKDTVEDGESDEEDSGPVSRKRRAKPLQLEETQTLSCSEVSTLETQPMDAGEDEQSIKEDPAKSLQREDEQKQGLTDQVETQATVNSDNEESRNERHPEPGTSGVTVRSKSWAGDKLKEEQQRAKCTEPSNRQTRSKNEALPNSRLDESEKEEEAAQPQKPRGKKRLSPQKEKKEEKQLETEINPQVESISLINEKREGRDAGKDEKDNGEIGEIKKQQEEIEGQHEVEQKDIQARFQAKNVERVKPEETKAVNNGKQENERCGRTRMENKLLEKEMGENEEKLIEHETEEDEERNKLITNETKTVENEIKGREEKERLEAEKRELGESLQKKEREHQPGLERKERETLEKVEVQQEHKEDENMLKVPTRGRRAARRTTTTQPKQDSAISTNDDVPARRTRSRSNSSNSERSTSSITTQEIRGRGRGRGRGGKTISEPPQAATARRSNRRRTVAAETSQQGSNDISPQGRRSRSNSSNSLNSEISSCETSQSRGRGGRQRGKGRKTEPGSLRVSSQSDQDSAPKPVARGRKSRTAEGSSSGVFQDNKEKVDSLQAATTRGQQKASACGSESGTADEQGQLNQEGCHAGEESSLTKRNVRGRGQKAVKAENVDIPAVSDGDEAKHRRMGRKREMVQNTEECLSSSSKVCRGKEKVPTIDTTLVEGEENPVQAKRRGRASSTQAKKNPKESPSEVEVKEECEDVELETAGKRGRGRRSTAQKKKTEEQDHSSGTSVGSMSQDATMVAPQPRTPTSSGSRKRQIPVDSPPVAKTPRSSSASPAASGRLQPARHSYKVLFTGVVDEAGERVLARLGGSLAKGVSDMNCLVTDKVRRTVKFLCAVAKGIPIVTTLWLEKSGKAGSLLPPDAFLVNDPEQEKKFSFSLQESLRAASSQPLLQGYEIHVTKSVKPEPPQMKDIISCSGATFLPKMPSSHKLQTVVISCEDDWLQCGPAVSASLPVVTAEFILTGILQHKVDFQTYTLSPPATNPQPAGGRGRGRGRRKT